MCRGVNIPWVGGSKYHGQGVNIPWLGGDQNTMGRGVKIPWVEFQFSNYCYNVMQN